MLRKVTAPRAVELGLTRNAGNVSNKTRPMPQDVKLPQSLVSGAVDKQRVVKIVSDNNVQNRMIDIAGTPMTLKAQIDTSKLEMAISHPDYDYEDIDISRNTGFIKSGDVINDNIDARSKVSIDVAVPVHVLSMFAQALRVHTGNC